MNRDDSLTDRDRNARGIYLKTKDLFETGGKRERFASSLARN
jgi:hypothetical protein